MQIYLSDQSVRNTIQMVSQEEHCFPLLLVGKEKIKQFYFYNEFLVV
jgi:hypothetical protein